MAEARLKPGVLADAPVPKLTNAGAQESIIDAQSESTRVADVGSSRTAIPIRMSPFSLIAPEAA